MWIEPKPLRRRTPVDLASIRWERRQEPRTALGGSATAAFYEPGGSVCLTSVELVDISDHGLGIRCETPVAAGSHCVINGPNLPRAQWSGVVANCMPDARGYRLGLHCQQPIAA